MIAFKRHKIEITKELFLLGKSYLSRGKKKTLWGNLELSGERFPLTTHSIRASRGVAMLAYAG